LAEKSRAAVVVKKAVVVKMKVVHVEHHQHSYSGAYAQNGGWGWPGGGWTGFSPLGQFPAVLSTLFILSVTGKIGTRPEG
jgi:hypothetical protein